MLVRMWRKVTPAALLVGMDAATMENRMEVSPKTKNRVAVRSCNPTPGYISRENSDSKR